ncbi:hypothetical protein SNE40_010429 [Patella caerulea]|uniref:ATP synthase subunit s-like protein n=1 Tax=Patella caerulea TaxID=87958 RepID=A0AAN8JXY0_PATCE
MAALVRTVQLKILQQQKQAIWMSQRGMTSNTKRKGFSLKSMRRLQQDYDISYTGLNRFLQKRLKEEFEKSESFIPERHQFLGPDLATAHFVVAREGSVKFVGNDRWFKEDENKNNFLPNRPVMDMYLEAINCSNTMISYRGLDNFIDLEYLKYLNFSNCHHVDDWFMSRLHQFSETLEFLDISGCKNVTDRGLECLHILKKLQGLKLSDMDHVENLDLIVLLLQERFPDCVIFGIDSKPQKQIETDINSKPQIITEKDSGTKPHLQIKTRT